MIIMKKKLFLAMMAIVAVFATLTFNACSSSDDDNNNGGGSGNGKAQVTAYVAIAPDQLNLFDVTVTFNNGTAVQLTNSNTTIKELVVSKKPFTGEDVKQTFRVYDLGTATVNSFPSTYTLTAESKVKAGIDLASQPASDYALNPVVEVVDATGTLYANTSLSYISSVNWSKVTSSSSILKTKTVTRSLDVNGKYIK